MSLQTGDRLYSPLVRVYRRKASGVQVLLTIVALLLSAATIYGHQVLVVQPTQADLVMAPVAYRPWYLADEPVPVRRTATVSVTPAGEKRTGNILTAAGPASQTSGLARLKTIGSARPNLAPQPGVNYGRAELAKKIESYFGATSTGSPRADLAAKALELAEAYAASAGASLSTFPLSATLERSVLERGWLWDLREGCEAELYLKFAAGRLDAMGCGLMVVPQGHPFGVGVVWIDKIGSGQRPVIVVVWENR